MEISKSFSLENVFSIKKMSVCILTQNLYVLQIIIKTQKALYRDYVLETSILAHYTLKGREDILLFHLYLYLLCYKYYS